MYVAPPELCLNPITNLLTTSPLGLQNLITNAASVSNAALGVATDAPPDPGVVQGWNGPYIWPHYPQPIVDPWGSPYIIEQSGSPNAAAPTWRLRSWGPNRTSDNGGNDDIVYPTSGAYYPSTGVLVVDVWKTNGLGMWPVVSPSDTSGWTVTLSPSNTSCTQGSPGNYYNCPTVFFGEHHLQIKTVTTVLLDQNIVVSTPRAYAKVFVPLRPCPQARTW